MRLFDREHHQRKQFLPGTRRTRSPDETLADFGRFMPAVGITRLADVTGLDTIGIPVIQAVRPNSRSLSVSQGKGVDVASAKVSAMMESIELWHAESIRAPLCSETYGALRATGEVADIDRLPRSAGAAVRHDVQRTWVRGWDLLRGAPSWVPFEVVNMNTLGTTGAQTFSSTSNGLASGNHLLEAIEHALCEVIERDTHAIYWARGHHHTLPTRVDLSATGDPALRALLDRFERAEVEVAAFEMESDVGLPTYTAAVVDGGDRAEWRRLGLHWGCGTHLSPAVALSRALTEAAQARLTIIAGSRDDNPPHTYAAEQDLTRLERGREVVFGTAIARGFPGEEASLETDSFDGDLAVILGRLARAGIGQVIAVDLTRPDMGIPVVKVVVPGLEAPPFMADYTAGERARRARSAS